MKYPEITMHLTLFIKLYQVFQIPSFYEGIIAKMVVSFPFLMQTSSTATSGVLPFPPRDTHR